MARIARVVVAGIAHQVTQRGNRRMGSDAFVENVERLVKRTLRPGKPGPKKGSKRRR